MEEKRTDDLEQQLQSIHSEKDLQRYLSDDAIDHYSSFHEYYKEYIKQNKIEVAEIVTLSHISRNYVYQILNGRKINPGRDKIIALCIASGMNFTETNRALKIAGKGILYAKNTRDAYITICINNRVRNVAKVNIFLQEQNCDILDI